MTPLWTPSPEQIGSAQITDLMAYFNGRLGRSMHDYAGLHRFSVHEPEAFWEGLWDHAGIGGVRQGPTLVNGRAMPGAQFFPESTVNFAKACLVHGRNDADCALICHQESGDRSTWQWGELRQAVANLAQHLRAFGVSQGQVVAGYLGNGPEAIIGALATLSLGAIWTSCSPDFGVQGVIDRFGQTKPVVLICTLSTRYQNKSIQLGERLQSIVKALPSLTACITCQGPVETLTESFATPESVQHHEWTTLVQGDAPSVFEAVLFNHPGFILYSSGTTGAPKCIVHSQGGALLQLVKEHRYHADIRPGDRVFYYTTCGWMMWNWLIAALASEATVVTYDGSPFAQGTKTLWTRCDQDDWQVFGTSAKYIAALDKHGFRPGDHFPLTALKAVLSTGSPLSHESFDFVYGAIKPDLLLGSISGGTDILSCFCLSCPILPVYRGQLQCMGLGLAVDVVDEHGESVTGEKGELVCRQPFPVMPVGFFGDADGSRYRAAYFERFPGLWAHGDFAEKTAEGGVIIYGRADATLNPGGVRIGTAEIYRQVETIPEVLESLAIGQPTGDDVRVVLFVVLAEGAVLDGALRERIKTTIRDNTTARHVPAVIAQVPELPRTVSGKIVELAVRNVVQGEPVNNKEALANPDALQYFQNHPDLHL